MRYNGIGSDHDYPSDVEVDGSGNVYVTGLSAGDYATIKYDVSGQEQWVARYDAGFSDNAAALAVDDSGNVYVTGHSSGAGTSEDYATIKYDPSGKELWVARFDGPGDSTDHAAAIARDPSGHIYVTGNCTGEGTGYDYATVKYDASGQELWAVRFDAPGEDDRGVAVAADNSGNVYVTGLSLAPGASYDFVTIKYQSDEPTDVGLDDDQIPLGYALGQNYPNPFNSSTIIEYALPGDTFVRLEVFNMLGEKVKTLVEGARSAGYHRIVFEGEGLSSGIYHYQINTGDFVETRKLVLLK
jgi:hypothetical protein